jgi:hypothetical protein
MKDTNNPNPNLNPKSNPDKPFNLRERFLSQFVANFNMRRMLAI